MPEIQYFRDRDVEPVREYIAELRRAGDRASADAYWRRVQLLMEHGPAIGMPYSRLIEPRERIFELRVRAHRFAYVEIGEFIVMLHAWRKRSQQLDRRELATAARRAMVVREEHAR